MKKVKRSSLCAFSAVSLCFAADLFLAGCASPWPETLPSTRYIGTVTNAVLGNQPVPGAVVTASRPGLRGISPAGIVSETLGRTTCDSRGHFRLETRTGYATDVAAAQRTDDFLAPYAQPTDQAKGLSWGCDRRSTTPCTQKALILPLRAFVRWTRRCNGSSLTSAHLRKSHSDHCAPMQPVM